LTVIPWPAPTDGTDDDFDSDDNASASAPTAGVVRVRPRTGLVLKSLVTVSALAHMALVAHVTGYGAYFTDANRDPGAWGTPPLIVGASLVIALVWGPSHVPSLPILCSRRSFLRWATSPAASCTAMLYTPMPAPWALRSRGARCSYPAGSLLILATRTSFGHNRLVPPRSAG
jgi:hypothetical protein